MSEFRDRTTRIVTNPGFIATSLVVGGLAASEIKKITNPGLATDQDKTPEESRVEFKFNVPIKQQEVTPATSTTAGTAEVATTEVIRTIEVEAPRDVENAIRRDTEGQMLLYIPSRGPRPYSAPGTVDLSVPSAYLRRPGDQPCDAANGFVSYFNAGTPNDIFAENMRAIGASNPEVLRVSTLRDENPTRSSILTNYRAGNQERWTSLNIGRDTNMAAGQVSSNEPVLVYAMSLPSGQREQRTILCTCGNELEGKVEVYPTATPFLLIPTTEIPTAIPTVAVSPTARRIEAVVRPTETPAPILPPTLTPFIYIPLPTPVPTEVPNPVVNIVQSVYQEVVVNNVNNVTNIYNNITNRQVNIVKVHVGSTPYPTPYPTVLFPSPTPRFETSTVVPTSSITSRPTESPTSTPSYTPTRPGETVSMTPVISVTATNTETGTPRPTRTETATPTTSSTATVIEVSSTPTPTPRRRESSTVVPSHTPTETELPTETPTNTPRPTRTATEVVSTSTSTATATRVRTTPQTEIPTATPGIPTTTQTPETTASRIPTSTPKTPTLESSPTNTPRPTRTATEVPTETAGRPTTVPQTELPTATVGNPGPTETPQPIASRIPTNTPKENQTTSTATVIRPSVTPTNEVITHPTTKPQTAIPVATVSTQPPATERPQSTATRIPTSTERPTAAVTNTAPARTNTPRPTSVPGGRVSFEGYSDLEETENHPTKEITEMYKPEFYRPTGDIITSGFMVLAATALTIRASRTKMGREWGESIKNIALWTERTAKELKDRIKG